MLVRVPGPASRYGGRADTPRRRLPNGDRPQAEGVHAASEGSLAASAIVKIEIAPDTLVVRVWAGSDGEIRARLSSGGITIPAADRDSTLSAVAAWLDQVIADLR
jgi:hypothetical protein